MTEDVMLNAERHTSDAQIRALADRLAREIDHHTYMAELRERQRYARRIRRQHTEEAAA